MKNPLNRQQAEVRINQLRQIINDYRYHYHVLDESLMSEAAADSLKHELSELESIYPELITSDSPTQRVAGSVLDGFSKVTHRQRMTSLNDVFNRQEVQDWYARTCKLLPDEPISFFCDIKMDGLACSLIYENGKLVTAVTRGDGFVGEDVTANVRTIESIPLLLREWPEHPELSIGRTEIRGEIVILKHNFDKLNQLQAESGKPLFANPRNLAAGTIRQLDPSLVASRPLTFRAYDVIRDNEQDIPTNDFAYEAAHNMGFLTNRQASIQKDINSVMEFVEYWDEARKKLPFNTDGLVIKVNNRDQVSRLGIVGKAPRGAVAFKYAAEEATTIVEDIVISIGRTGAATPVAVFAPVVVAGTTVQHASLHNADEIARKDVRVGDTVIIFKAGDIIPQVQRVIVQLRPNGTKKFNMQAELKRQYPELVFERPDGEVVYRAMDMTGPIILKRSLEHYASKAALDIDGLGEKNVETLVDSGLVDDIADIYTLGEEQVIELDRFAELSAKNLVSAIAAKKSPSLPRFIYGLGIRHVGVQTAQDLAERFGSIQALSVATIDDLAGVDGIGKVVAESIVAWFADEDNGTLLSKLSSLGVEAKHISHANGPLHGKSFVITGSLESMKREAAAEIIRSLGGTFQSSVGKGTTYLVAGGKVGASKLQKAAALGVEVIDEQKLLELIA